jgi:carboxymethylenebutenolidase
MALPPELDSLTPSRRYGRRDFVRTAVGSGFAAAVLPIGAQAIRTDSNGLTVGEVLIPSGGFRLPAYRAMPEGQVNLPVVLVVSEVFGVHEYIADVARRFAKLGYLAIAPELFVRQGDAQGYGELAKLLSEVIAKVPDEQVMGDLDACVDWAAANGGDVRRLGITGFCWGGRIVWLYDAHTGEAKRTVVKAGVAWYGRLVGTSTPLQPAHPVDRAARLAGPVLGLYGGADAGIPAESIERMKQALAAGGPAARASEFVVYPEAPHAFHADYRPSYRQAAAEDGWRRCIAWLKAHGVA